jgi:hypothetical protein
MGPSARHTTPQALAARIRALPRPFTVTVDLQVWVFARRLGRPFAGVSAETPRAIAWTPPMGKDRA